MVSTPDGFLPLRGYRGCLKQSLGFHVLMQALGFALYVPLASVIAHRLVGLSGEPVVSNFDLVGFVLSPSGLLFVLVVASVAVSVLLAEFTGQTWIAGHAIAGRQTTVLATVALVLHRLPRLLLLGLRIFLRLLLLAVPFLLLVGLLWYMTLRDHEVNYYLSERPPEWRRALWVIGALGLVYLVLANQQLARWIHSIPLLVFDRLSPRAALTESARLTQGRRMAIALRIAAWWIPMIALAFVTTAFGRQISDALLDWAGMEFRRVLPLIVVFAVVATAFSLLWSGVALGGHQFIVTRMFWAAREQVDGIGAASMAWQEALVDPGEQRSRRFARPVIVAVLGLLPLGLLVGHHIASKLIDDETVAITAHRGASIGAPENTMAAFDAAVAAASDYIELDVQRASDGGIVVFHDAELMRMAADPRQINTLTTPELAAIDVGSRFDAAFASQTVPTLEQVIDRVRGHLKINVELKYNVPDPGLAPAVVDLLRREDFLDQVVITSLDAAALAQVRSLEPSLQTGQILTASVGNVPGVSTDFVSLNAAHATPSLIRKLHARGKSAHVWTINTPEAILLMIERGADNLITDDPVLARRVIQERAALSKSERLALRLRVLFDRPPREVTHPEAVTVL